MMMQQRYFLPGSCWLYYKIYAGSITVEQLLLNEINKVVCSLIDRKLITQWFFVRYADPEFHLRIRFKLSNIDNLNIIITLFYEQIKHRVENGSVVNVQINTYLRELERYKIDLIDVAEDIFYIDSSSTLSILTFIASHNLSEKKWLIALNLIDSFLSAFNFSLNEKQQFCHNIYLSYSNEFSINHFQNKYLCGIFKANKDEIIKALSFMSDDIGLILQRKRNEIQNIYKANITKFKRYNINYLVAQYIHMMINRFFESKGREYELLLYCILNKYYLYRIYNQ